MSIWTKNNYETPSAVRTVESITKEVDQVRARIADLSARRDALTAEQTAIGIEQNPSAAFRREKIASELPTLTSEIEKDGRFERALSFELAQLQIPAVREDAERLAVKTEAARADLAQSIEASASRVMPKAAALLALMETANVAHANAERLSGEMNYSPRFAFDRQTISVIRPLKAYGAIGAAWNEWMDGKPIPLGNLFLHGA